MTKLAAEGHGFGEMVGLITDGGDQPHKENRRNHDEQKNTTDSPTVQIDNRIAGNIANSGAPPSLKKNTRRDKDQSHKQQRGIDHVREDTEIRIGSSGNRLDQKQKKNRH